MAGDSGKKPADRSSPKVNGTKSIGAKRLARLKVDVQGLGVLVVALVIGAVVSVAALSIAVVDLLSLEIAPASIHPFDLGAWTTYYSTEIPAIQLILVAAFGMLGVAVAAVTIEIGATILLTMNPKRHRLAAYRRVRTNKSELVGPVDVTVIIPAHNEESILASILASLREQTRKPNRVIVVADNCTDRTAEVAIESGAEVFHTTNNAHKKAGALNQVLRWLLPEMGPSNAVLIMDADTILTERFIEVAAQRLNDDQELAAVGGLFTGEEGLGYIGLLQRNEFARYATQIRARRGRVFVLTGTATMFRADALLDVSAARGIYIPGEPGAVYDTAALTEDNELTLALKSLGASMNSPQECIVVTEIMPTWKALWQQRQRWQRGALENLSAYGITTGTVRYWGQQFGIGYGVVALNSAILLMIITAFAVEAWVWFPFWMTVTSVFILERVIGAWRNGWKGRLLAALLIPEITYDIYLQAVFIKSLWDIARNRTAQWIYVERTNQP